MPEVTLEMLLSGTKPASAPIQAAQAVQGAELDLRAPGGESAANEDPGAGSFAEALSRQTTPSETTEAVEDAAAEAGDDAKVEVADEGESDVGEPAKEAPVEASEEGETELAEVELPPGFELLDMPVAAVILPQGGNGLPAETLAAAAASGEMPPAGPTAANAASMAEMAMEGDGEGALANQRRAAMAAMPTLGQKPGGGEEGGDRSFSQLLTGRLGGAPQGQPVGEGATPAAPQLAALQPTSLAAAAPQAAAATAPTLRSSIDTPFRQPGWNDSLGNRVVWMAGEKIEKAEIRLNPPTLGPIEVRVTMNGDQASVSFVSQNASVRDALEQAMPRLREMMGENGLSLADTDVSDAHQEQRAQEGGEGDGRRGRGDGEDGVDGEEGELGEGQVVEMGDGMLSLYA